ncbi:MAG: hypothetical protein WBQ63_00285, partial [Candidatus Acidiferrales bacterium]
MNQTFRVRAVIVAGALALLCSLPIAAAGQGSPSASNSQPDTAKLAAKKTPHLADGHPNLNGIWYRPLLFLGAAEQDGDTLKAVNRPDPAFAAAIAPLPAMYSPSYKPEL